MMFLNDMSFYLPIFKQGNHSYLFIFVYFVYILVYMRYVSVNTVILYRLVILILA